MVRFPVQSIHGDVHCKLIPPDLSLSQIAQATQLVEDDRAQGTGILYSQLQRGIGLFFTCVVMDNATTKGGTLIGIKTVTSKFAMSDAADHMNEVPSVEVFEPVLIQVMSVGAAVKIHRRRVLDPVLVTSVLCNIQYT